MLILVQIQNSCFLIDVVLSLHLSLFPSFFFNLSFSPNAPRQMISGTGIADTGGSQETSSLHYTLHYKLHTTHYTLLPTHCVPYDPQDTPHTPAVCQWLTNPPRCATLPLTKLEVSLITAHSWFQEIKNSVCVDLTIHVSGRCCVCQGLQLWVFQRVSVCWLSEPGLNWHPPQAGTLASSPRWRGWCGQSSLCQGED